MKPLAILVPATFAAGAAAAQYTGTMGDGIPIHLWLDPVSGEAGKLAGLSKVKPWSKSGSPLARLCGS